MATDPRMPIPYDEPGGKPERGLGIYLSGGGYRAMLFHTGSLWRLHETGLLRSAARISSVSGGSITAALLGLRWNALNSDSAGFMKLVVQPIRAMAGKTIDAKAVIIGLIRTGSISDRLVAAYERHLFGAATLQDLPDSPRFVINAANVQSGALWRFMKPYMRDYRVGMVEKPVITLAQAVTASSAFPPILSPFVMRLDPASFTPNSGLDLQREPFTSKVILSNGGVYDNLGLEAVWKRYDTVFVSDGGGKLEAEEKPKTDWAWHSYRVLDLIDNQVRSLRKRQLIGSYIASERKGAYWGIRTNIADYRLPNALPCPFHRTTELARVPTRLQRVNKDLQERLINWGYAVCDAALRKHEDPALPAPADFPYSIGV